MRRLAQHHDKVPAAPVFDLVNGNMHLAYASNIKTVGASVTSSVGQLNWGAGGLGAVERAASQRLGPGPVLSCDPPAMNLAMPSAAPGTRRPWDALREKTGEQPLLHP